MAEATGLRNSCLPYPVYGLPYGVAFPLLDADGDPVSPSSPDSEISKNGDTFADCTNEATEIATSSGVCYLLLTGTELTADVVAVRIQSTGAKTTILTLYPRKLVSVRAGTSASGGSSTSTIVLDASAAAVDDYYNGMIVAAVIDSVTEVRVITDYTGSTQTATVTPDWNTAPDNDDTFTIYLPEGVQLQQSNLTYISGAAVSASSGLLNANVTQLSGDSTAADNAEAFFDGTGYAGTNNVIPLVTTTTTATNVTTVNGLAADVITATSIASDAITDAKVASDVTIASVTGSVGSVATGGISAASFAANAITAAKLDPDVTTELQSGLATASALSAVESKIDTIDGIVDAILVDTAEIGAAGAGLTVLATAANLATVAGYIDTEIADIQSRLPAALVSGRMDASVGAMAANVLTATAINADAITAAKVAADVTTEIQSGLATAAALSLLETRMRGLVLYEGIIGSTGNSTTTLHLDGLIYGNDEINDCLLVIYDNSEDEYHARWVEDWVAATKVVTVSTLPFTPENAVDAYWLLPTRRDGTALDAAGVRTAIGLASANLDTQLTAIDDYIDSEVAAIKAKTDQLTFTTANRVDCQVYGMQADTLTASALATDAVSEIQSGLATAANLATVAGYLDTEVAAILEDTGTTLPAQISALNNLSQAQAQTAAESALQTYNLDHLVKSAVDTNWATTVHLDSVLGHLADNGTTATFDRTTDSQEAIRDRGDADWVTATGFSTLDAAGVRTAVGLASANLDTQLSTIDDFLDTEIAAIKAKTDNLPADPADASDIASAFSTVNSTLSTIAGYIDTEVSTILSRLGTPSDLGSGASVAANLVDIEAQTDDIGAAGAGLTALASAANLATLTAYVDTEVAAIKAKTDNLPAAPAATGDIPTVSQIWTTALTEAYAADGAAFTAAQGLFMIWSALSEFAISSTTITCKKLDASTTSMTFTLDSSTAPTSRTRAS